jgi:hypothetical protein
MWFLAHENLRLIEMGALRAIQKVRLVFAEKVGLAKATAFSRARVLCSHAFYSRGTFSAPSSASSLLVVGATREGSIKRQHDNGQSVDGFTDDFS